MQPNLATGARQAKISLLPGSQFWVLRACAGTRGLVPAPNLIVMSRTARTAHVRPIESAALGLMLMLANLRAFFFWPLHPDATAILGPAWLEAFLWILCLTVVAVFGRVKFGNIVRHFRTTWVVTLYITLCAISIIYSVAPSYTAFRTTVLALSTLGGAYIGIRFQNDILTILKVMSILIISMCLISMYTIPSHAIMRYPPYTGAWRALFWHKNHLGNILIYCNSIVLISTLADWKQRRIDILAIVMFAASWFLIIRSHSASGMIGTVILDVMVIVAAVWLLVRSRLEPLHYLILFVSFVVLSTAVLANVDVILTAFHRDSTLTGRTDLWKYLVASIISKAPWFGSGFGAVWSQDVFRRSTQGVLGWMYPVMIGDNGFIDVALGCGLMGIFLVAGAIGQTAARSLARFLREASLESFAGFAVVGTAVVANLSYSLLFETGSMTWMLLMIVLFSSSWPDEARHRESVSDRDRSVPIDDTVEPPIPPVTGTRGRSIPPA